MECDRIYKAFQDYRAKKEELEKNYENQKKELENKFSKDNKAIEQLLEKEIMKYMHNNKNLMEFLDKKISQKEKELDEVNSIKKMFNLDKINDLGDNKSNSNESMELESQGNGEDIMKKDSDETVNGLDQKNKLKGK